MKTALTPCEAAFKKSNEAGEHPASAEAFRAFRAGWYANADASASSETVTPSSEEPCEWPVGNCRFAPSAIEPPAAVELVADPERECMEDMTHILVRAKDSQGRWRSMDIAELDRRSLHAWLRSRGGKNMYAENVVLALLGHAQLIEAQDV